jgi:Skp family chaperone for outer membrane proteins
MTMFKNGALTLMALAVIGTAATGYTLAALAGDDKKADASVSQVETQIAVLDVQKLLTQSEASKSIQKQLDAEEKTFQADFAKKEKALRDQEKSIVEQKKTLSAEEFEKKKSEFEKQLIETRKQVQKHRKAREKAASEALVTVRQKILEIVAGIAKEKNYKLVVTQQNVVLAADTMDITEAVMGKLNGALKDVKLSIKDEG